MTQFEQYDWLMPENFINIMIECLPYTATAMPTNTLTTLGASATAGMVLNHQNRNIPSLSSEELPTHNVNSDLQNAMAHFHK